MIAADADTLSVKFVEEDLTSPTRFRSQDRIRLDCLSTTRVRRPDELGPPLFDREPMKCLLLLIPTLLSVAALLPGCGANAPSPDTSGQPPSAFAPTSPRALNSDQGWAGALNENVTVHADRPFRVRFEVERPAAPTGARAVPAPVPAERRRLDRRRRARLPPP